MSTIKSDLGDASLKATALKNATDSISQLPSVETDTQTTVMGNVSAQQAIQSAQNTAQQIADAVSLASANIRSVAEQFEAMDNQVEQNIKKNSGGFF
ncbi:TIGR04197 family type VII secretion effector [Vagococcus sp. BWB3-3]|uniref:TIGR04197 family type VII secretion effector n=1 Tax=Vagococcus allomyrinae TaxID=2794353 RepID=A0A940PE27_9ENTE|nr:TIGR04197 family type VII secretion effector [Vagococcus allomyrinae]MBP1042273.1 TIGR04197 family type VII secretion effector [Vagococcus allomyrinae]